MLCSWLNHLPDPENVLVNVADSEEGDNPDIVTFLDSQSNELRLDLDPNDLSLQTLNTNYHLEDEIISSSHLYKSKPTFYLTL